MCSSKDRRGREGERVARITPHGSSTRFLLFSSSACGPVLPEALSRLSYFKPLSSATIGNGAAFAPERVVVLLAALQGPGTGVLSNKTGWVESQRVEGYIPGGAEAVQGPGGIRKVADLANSPVRLWPGSGAPAAPRRHRLAPHNAATRPPAAGVSVAAPRSVAPPRAASTRLQAGNGDGARAAVALASARRRRPTTRRPVPAGQPGRRVPLRCRRPSVPGHGLAVTGLECHGGHTQQRSSSPPCRSPPPPRALGGVGGGGGTCQTDPEEHRARREKKITKTK